MDDYKNNEYEILNVQNDLRLLRRIRPLCLQKAKDMCKFLTKNTNKLVCWYFDPDEDEIGIYAEKSNFEEAMKYLDEFEHSYTTTLRKRKMIANHRHKKG